MTIPKILLVVFLIFGPAIALLGYLGYLYPPYITEKAPSEAVEQQTTLADLLDAIEWVESGGDPDAVGDGGNAVGNFQIWKIYVDDVNRINKINHKGRYSSPIYYFYYERESPYCSRYMVKTYLEHYATKERIGREPTFEDMARIHNGGGDGWRNDPQWFVRNRNYTLERAKKKIANTKEFWEKVRNYLDNLQ